MEWIDWDGMVDNSRWMGGDGTVWWMDWDGTVDLVKVDGNGDGMVWWRIR